MDLGRTEGISHRELSQQRRNLWLGISLGNKWFTQENLQRLINFGLENTQDSLLIWVPGRMHASNIRYIEDISRAAALKKAFAQEAGMLQMIRGIVEGMPDGNKQIMYANYDDVLVPRTIKQREVMYREFAEQSAFYDRVMDIAEENLFLRGRTISKDRIEAVALYSLQELSVFLDGIATLDNETMHTVVLYPGWGKLDDLVMDIRNSAQFADLRKNLHLQNEIGIVEVQ